MDLIKSPHDILMEQAGLPHFKEGKSVGDLQAEMIAHGHTPQRFAEGKSVAADKHIIFNVGKDVNGVKNVLSNQVILEKMRSLGFDPVHAHQVFAQPNTTWGPHEDTLVVKAKGNPQDLHMKTHILAEHLSQDAIPAKLEGAAAGVLAGPKAGDWGPYDPRRFIEHGSTTAAGNNPSFLQEAYTKAKTALTPSMQTQEAVGNLINKAKPLAKWAGHAFTGAGLLDEGLGAYQHIAQGEPEKAVGNAIGAASMFAGPEVALPVSGLMAIKDMPPDNPSSALALTQKVAPNPEYLQNTD